MPSYWEDGETGRGKSPLVVRQDGYAVEEENRRLMIKDFNVELEFTGGLRRGGKGLGLRYTATRPRTLGTPLSSSRWALRQVRMATSRGISLTVRVDPSKSRPPGETRPLRSTRAKTSALASAVVRDGACLLYGSVRTEEDYFYLERRISELRSPADKAENMGEQEARDGLDREKRRLFKKLTSGLLHLYRDFASYPVKALYELGASAICLGYPLSAAREEGNELTVNLWSYRKLMDAV